MAIVTMVASLINENTSPTRERVVHLRNVPKFHLQKSKKLSNTCRRTTRLRVGPVLVTPSVN